MKHQLHRREFLRVCAACGVGAAVPAWAAPEDRLARLKTADLREAASWEARPGGRVRCTLCPNLCEREEGGVTACRTRINRGGKLYSLTYGKPCVVFEDALEKNPLYHVDPGRSAISVATAGCNLHCSYCQNWEFSQAGPWETKNMDLSPEAVVQKAKERQLRWITFSYTEPVAYYEYALATARLAKQEKLNVAVVTAGYIHPKPLEKLIECSDAFSVTLKGYTNDFYHKVVGCSLDDVWNSIRALARSGRWLEVVTLVVPTLNDEEKGFRSIAQSLAKLNPSIPLHFLRFSPAWRLRHLPPTPQETLEKARDIACREGLDFVYLANLPGHDGAHTFCPACGKMLIQRVGFKVLGNELKNGRCPSCRTALPGVAL